MLPPSSITDTVRNVLQARVTHASTLVNLATITVALGVALEGVDLLYDAVAWVKRKRRENRERSEFRELALISPVGEIKIAGESHSDHPKWVKRTLRLGLLFVVAGVVGEWRCGAELEHAHDAVHKYDLAKLTEADQKAGKAADSAKTAHDEVAAVGEEVDAIDERLDAASAELDSLATGTKALKDDIAAEEEELKRINSPRTLTNSADMVEKLRKFNGPEYTFTGVFNNEESIQFLLAIDSVLQQAGWNRVPPPKVGTLDLFGLPVFGANGPLLAETSGSGVQISVEVPAGTYKTVDEMPLHVRAAVELNKLLFSGMYPPEPEGKDKKPSAKEGRSGTVQILVGSKRLGANAKANAQKAKAK
jgi:hypothetical protein